MPNNIKKKLIDKGWSDKDIKKTLDILNGGRRSKKSSQMRFLDSVIYWIVLFVSIVGNLVISVILIPFLVVMDDVQLYLIIIILAFSFGLLFNLLIRDIENLDKSDHILAGVFIPALAIINIFIITRLANYLADILFIKNNFHDPVLISIVYVSAFIAPYLFYKSISRFMDRVVA